MVLCINPRWPPFLKDVFHRNKDTKYESYSPEKINLMRNFEFILRSLTFDCRSWQLAKFETLLRFWNSCVGECFSEVKFWGGSLKHKLICDPTEKSDLICDFACLQTMKTSTNLGNSTVVISGCYSHTLACKIMNTKQTL